MSERLEGTVALVTGASSGIGEATAKALVAAGAKVAILARRKDRLEALAAELQGKAHVIVGDVTERPAAESAVAETVKTFGRLDTLVNNAGVMLLGPIENAPLEEWERMVQLNVLGMLYTAHAALPHLLEAAKSGPRHVSDLVNVSSVAGRFPRLGSGVYNLTKHGVTGFSESLRQEVTKRHVRVSMIEPGMVKTELQDHLRPEVKANVQAARGEMEPLEAEDIADAITYIVTRKRHIAINEILIRPTEQER
jgi:NADP-dependent 3-hydroxy acid dehydrogenase YdfG